MDFSWMFIDDDSGYPLYAAKMPFGSPGEESLHYGHQTVNDTKGQLEDVKYTMHAVRGSSNMGQSSRLETVSDYGVDTVPHCPDSPTLNRALAACGIDVALASEDASSNNEATDFLSMTAAPGLLASHYRSVEDDRKHIEWCPADEATSEIFPASLTHDHNGTWRTGLIERSLIRRKPHAVFHGIGKRKPKCTGLAAKKRPKSVKGLTMCLRTLLRQLLAGSSWVLAPSIRKDAAYRLIRLLIGPELERSVNIELPMTDTPHLSEEWREIHYTAVLAKIISLYTGTWILSGEVEKCFMLNTGPYTPSPRFISILGGRPWPPYLPNEKELRVFGCHRPGEVAMRTEETNFRNPKVHKDSRHAH